MRRFGWLLVSMFFALPALADDVFVINVMRNIPLADDEPVYKDFYLNGGEAAGLKKNLVVTIVRKLTIRDASGSQVYGDVEVPVGQLRVLAVYGRVAIAREYKLLSRDENPMLEQTGLLVGDKVDLKGAFTDSKAWSSSKRQVSGNETETSAGRATASVVAPAATTSSAPLAPTGPTAANAGMPTEFVKPAAATEPVSSSTKK